jgi:hypothetical protein
MPSAALAALVAAAVVVSGAFRIAPMADPVKVVAKVSPASEPALRTKNSRRLIFFAISQKFLNFKIA